MKFVAIIPARYSSTRFPGKPLAQLGGKPVIEHVFSQVKKAVENVVVATDDDRIFRAVEAFGGEAVMTKSTHPSGTDRVFEAFEKLGANFDAVINVQGDEPFIQPEQIRTLMDCFRDPETEIATLVKPFSAADSFNDLASPNTPKVVFNARMEALYFSRSVIPFLRGVDRRNWTQKHTFYKHIGMYAYRADALEKITKMPPSSLELAESLEQLRWLQNGLRIKVGITHLQTIGIDTPDDLERAQKFLENLK